MVGTYQFLEGFGRLGILGWVVQSLRLLLIFLLLLILRGRSLGSYSGNGFVLIFSIVFLSLGDSNGELPTFWATHDVDVVR